MQDVFAGVGIDPMLQLNPFSVGFPSALLGQLRVAREYLEAVIAGAAVQRHASAPQQQASETSSESQASEDTSVDTNAAQVALEARLQDVLRWIAPDNLDLSGMDPSRISRYFDEANLPTLLSSGLGAGGTGPTDDVQIVDDDDVEGNPGA